VRIRLFGFLEIAAAMVSRRKAIRKMALIEKGTAVKRKYSGITLIEILTVVGIIVVLAGLLIPAMTFVRKSANVTKQRAELNTIELAITTFKNDYGDYPPSVGPCELNPNDYSGAQILTEALCGWDLLGFHPDSRWRSDGRDCSFNRVYDANTINPANLLARRGPYLDMAHISVFKLNQLFETVTTLAPDTYVLCDVFGVRNLQSGNRRVLAGTPILYYKANPASKDPNVSATYADRIYNVEDNRYLVALGTLTSTGAAGNAHRLGDNTNYYKNFYDFIADTREAIPWSYNPESYILISAGPDGEYGTRDDICNFPTP
jgi:type II secretory pathway pseudopilin PulG